MNNYFDHVASDYAQRSSQGLWKKMRDREFQAVWSLLERFDRKAKLLELGCGAGFYCEEIFRRGFVNVSALDSSEAMLSQLQNKNIKKHCADICEYEESTDLDIILCAGALEFLPSAERLFSKSAKMLKPGGHLLLLYPPKRFSGVFYWLFHRYHRQKIRLFTRNEILAWAKKMN